MSESEDIYTTWSVEDVGEWLKTNKLDLLIDRFRKNHVSGHTLTSVDPDDKSWMQIVPEFGLIVRFKSALKTLKKTPTVIRKKETTVTNNDLNKSKYIISISILINFLYNVLYNEKTLLLRFPINAC